MSDARLWINVAASVTHGLVDEGEELANSVIEAEFYYNPDPRQRAKILRVALMNVHMIAIALRQIDRHLQLLASQWSGDLARKGAKYRTLYSSSEMKDFRDVVEHSADYTADEGSKPELKQSDQAGYSVLAIGGEIRGISVFGKTYDVLPVIAAATDLLPLLAPDKRT